LAGSEKVSQTGAEGKKKIKLIIWRTYYFDINLCLSYYYLLVVYNLLWLLWSLSIILLV
jgi:hypothetical protein